MNNKIFIYKIRRAILKIMFDCEDNDYSECPDLFNVHFLDAFRKIIKIYVNNNFLGETSINNIQNFLFQARGYNDEKRSERIEIINDIIRTINTQNYDNSLQFYRYQLCDRSGNRNYLSPLKFTDEQVEEEIEYINYCIAMDYYILLSHLEETSDLDFIKNYLPNITHNLIYYGSLNIFLKEEPTLFKNLTFYNRMICILESNNEICNEFARTNKAVVKAVKKVVKKIK